MTNLDSNYIDPANVSPRPTGMKWGFILGCATAALSILYNLTGMIDYTGTKSNLLPTMVNMLVFAGCFFMAVKEHRDNDLGGYITIGRSLGVSFWTALIAGIIGALTMFLIMKFMIPDFKEKIMESAMTQAENKGQDPEKVKQGLDMMGFMFNPAMMSLMALLGSLLYGLIFGLINGLILKKDSPRTF